MSKRKNLQPWLDYFDMLHTYEQGGFLQMEAEKHEAYVTQPALFAMSKGDDPQQQLMDGSIIETVRSIHAYAAFRSTKGVEYMAHPFAIHVVKDGEPHDLFCTILITHHRSWRTLWGWRDHIEVIPYETAHHIKSSI